MKKLVMVMAVLVSAFMVNAASIAWDFVTIPLVDEYDEDGGAYDGLTVYFVDGANYDAFSSALSSNEDVSGLYMTQSTVGAEEAAFIMGSGDAISYNSKGDTIDAYAFIVDTTENKYFEIVAHAVVGDSALSGGIVNFQTEEEAVIVGPVSSWAAISAGGTTPGGEVPEPTSGLLLMLGVAGLALRRKVK